MRPFRPAGGQGGAAIVAEDVAAQREVLVHVRLSGGVYATVQTFLDALIGVEADQGLMLGGAQRDIPTLHLNIACIHRLVQQLSHALVLDDACGILWKQRIFLQEPHHSRLVFEPAAGKTFEGFHDHRGGRFPPHQNLAASGDPLIGHADRCLKDPEPVHDTGNHAVLRLLPVLLPRMLGDGCQQVFDKDGVGVFAKLDRGRFQNPARLGDGSAQLKMRLKPSCQSRYIIDDNDRPAAFLFAQESKHILHGRAFGEFAGDIIPKDIDDFIALHTGEHAAPCLLAIQPCAIAHLFEVGYTRVDHRPFKFLILHFARPSRLPASPWFE